jgi:hypothetical protein
MLPDVGGVIQVGEFEPPSAFIHVTRISLSVGASRGIEDNWLALSV